MLNDSKAAVVLLGTKQQLGKLDNLAISVGNANIMPCSRVKNLSVIFDNNMTMEDSVNNICKTAYFYIRLLGKLRKFLDKETSAMITHAFVTSRLRIIVILYYMAFPVHCQQSCNVSLILQQELLLEQRLWITLHLFLNLCIGYLLYSALHLKLHFYF